MSREYQNIWYNMPSLLNTHFRIKIIPQKMLQWVWGQYVVEDKFVSFESGAEGGYKCKLCAEEIGKRWDTLKMHLLRNHQMPKHRIKIKSLKIPAIKEKCSVCQKTS